MPVSARHALPIFILLSLFIPNHGTSFDLFDSSNDITVSVSTTSATQIEALTTSVAKHDANSSDPCNVNTWLILAVIVSLVLSFCSISLTCLICVAFGRRNPIRLILGLIMHLIREGLDSEGLDTNADIPAHAESSGSGLPTSVNALSVDQMPHQELQGGLVEVELIRLDTPALVVDDLTCVVDLTSFV